MDNERNINYPPADPTPVPHWQADHVGRARIASEQAGVASSAEVKPPAKPILEGLAKVAKKGTFAGLLLGTYYEDPASSDEDKE